MNLPELDPLDRRLNAWRPDLADSDLQGKVEAERFVDGIPVQVCVAFTDLRSKPNRDAGIDTQLLCGDRVKVFEENDDWIWARKEEDGYVGWIERSAVTDKLSNATHRVCVPRTFLYPGADFKLPHHGIRSLGTGLAIVGEHENRGMRYFETDTGDAVFANHVCPIDQHMPDYVSAAELLLGTPYLWGGSTAFGVDCSGLVQLAMKVSGHKVLRDTDMQAATIGEPFALDEGQSTLQRGDLVFWRGHVGICQGEGMLLHANAHSMNVASEPVAQAIDRIAYLYEKPLGFRRPVWLGGQ